MKPLSKIEGVTPTFNEKGKAGIQFKQKGRYPLTEQYRQKDNTEELGIVISEKN